MKAQKALMETMGAKAAARRQGGENPPVPSYPRQIYSEIFYEMADFATGEVITADGQLYADALVGRTRVDLLTHGVLGDLPVSTQYHDDESTEWHLFSYGPTMEEEGKEMLWPWPIECTFLEEIPFITTPDQWSYLGAYFYRSHAGDAYYAFNADTNVTHYWLQDLYNQEPLLNVFEGYYSEELVGYVPVTMELNAQPPGLFIVPARLDCVPAQSEEAFNVINTPQGKHMTMPSRELFRPF